jgi:mannosyltransferase OCH1-like enzyme
MTLYSSHDEDTGRNGRMILNSSKKKTSWRLSPRRPSRHWEQFGWKTKVECVLYSAVLILSLIWIMGLWCIWGLDWRSISAWIRGQPPISISIMKTSHNSGPIARSTSPTNNTALVFTDSSQEATEEWKPISKIPYIIIFTHYIRLLEPLPPHVKDDTEIQALARNVQHSVDMHPGVQVRFLDDTDCILSIQRVMGDQSPLIHYFQKESQGMYKADICRAAALWETGGIYLDVDVGVRENLWNVLHVNTTWATVRVHRESHYPRGFFQAFWASSPQHPMVHRYLKLFLDYYEKRLSIPQGPLGVQILGIAYDEYASADSTTTTLSATTQDGMDYNMNATELWYEVKYADALALNWVTSTTVPPPVWGTRRACKFVVVANIVDDKHHHPKALVPLYSRIGGSRMCPMPITTTIRTHSHAAPL